MQRIGMMPLVIIGLGLFFAVAPAFSQNAYTGKASGTLTVDGKSTPLRYAHMVEVDNVEGVGLLLAGPRQYQVIIFSDRSFRAPVLSEPPVKEQWAGEAALDSPPVQALRKDPVALPEQARNAPVPERRRCLDAGRTGEARRRAGGHGDGDGGERSAGLQPGRHVSRPRERRVEAVLAVEPQRTREQEPPRDDLCPSRSRTATIGASALSKRGAVSQRGRDRG
jgi:hypothetical protein